MNKNVVADLKEVLDAVSYLPSVSIIMPFEPKMSLKTELSHKLKLAVAKIEQQLMENYDPEKVNAVMNKLHKVIADLNYDTYKKSIAIFVSPVFEKVFYLDIPVEEKLMVDESFEIRDIVYSKKELHKYLVLILSAEWTKIYLVDGTHLLRIKTASPDNVNAIWNEPPTRVANFSDPSYRKEVMLDKFLKYTDEGLAVVLNDLALPVFVLGAKRTIGHFKKITKNARHIVEYIPGNYSEAPETEIKRILQSHISEWKKVKQAELLLQLEAARDAGRLVSGIKNVWKQVAQKNGKLLVVEKDFAYAAQLVNTDTILPHEPSGNNQLFIKDAVDDIMEKVLMSGGDVAFVDEGQLTVYDKIALITHY